MAYEYATAIPESDTFFNITTDPNEYAPSEKELLETHTLRDSEVVVRRSVGSWSIPPIVVDYSITDEWIDSVDYITGKLVGGYIQHAFPVPPKLRELIKSSGELRGYYGRGAGLGRPVCLRTKNTWSARAWLVKDDILSLQNEVRPGYDNKNYNSVCVACQGTVKRNRSKLNTRTERATVGK